MAQKQSQVVDCRLAISAITRLRYRLLGHARSVELLHHLRRNLTSRTRPGIHIQSKTCYVHLEASDCDNEKRVAKLPFKKANCRVEFWRYPPILPGQSKIDNLSLYLALDSAHDPKVRDYRDKLIETFPWNNQEVKTPWS